MLSSSAREVARDLVVAVEPGAHRQVAAGQAAGGRLDRPDLGQQRAPHRHRDRQRGRDRQHDHDRHHGGDAPEIVGGIERGFFRQLLLAPRQLGQALGHHAERAVRLGHRVGADRFVQPRDLDHVAHRRHVQAPGAGGLLDVAQLGLAVARRRLPSQALQAGEAALDVGLLLLDVAHQGLHARVRETAADPGQDLVGLGVRPLRRRHQRRRRPHVGGALLHDGVERVVLAQHGDVGAAGQEHQQHQHGAGRQQQFGTDPQARQHQRPPASVVVASVMVSSPVNDVARPFMAIKKRTAMGKSTLSVTIAIVLAQMQKGSA